MIGSPIETTFSDAQSKREALRDLSTGHALLRRFFKLDEQFVGARHPAAATEVSIIHRTRVRFQVGMAVVSLMVIGLLFSQAASAQDRAATDPDQIVRDLLSSTSWADCLPKTSSMKAVNDDQILESIACVAQTDPATAKIALAYVDDTSIVGLAYRDANYDTGFANALVEDFTRSVNKARDAIRLAEQPSMTPTLINPKSSPVILNTCVLKHSPADPQWILTSSFTPAKDLTAIKLRVEEQDAFGVVLQTDDFSPTGAFSATSSVVKAWTIGDSHMPPVANMSRVRCSIVAAILTDSTVWNAPPIAPTNKPHPKHT